MITKQLADMLRKQIGQELQAAHMYMGIGSYFAHEGLDKWAALFHEQSDEERGHAMKIVRFLSDVGEEAAFPALKESSASYASAEAAVRAALKSEQVVSDSFRKMAAAAMKHGDFTTFEFLQWFIAEQVEEEAKMSKLLELIASGVNLFVAEELLGGEST